MGDAAQIILTEQALGEPHVVVVEVIEDPPVAGPDGIEVDPVPRGPVRLVDPRDDRSAGRVRDVAEDVADDVDVGVSRYFAGGGLDRVAHAAPGFSEREARVEHVAAGDRLVRDDHQDRVNMIDTVRIHAPDELRLGILQVVVPVTRDLPPSRVLLDEERGIERGRQARRVHPRDHDRHGLVHEIDLQDVPDDIPRGIRSLRATGEQAERQQQQGCRGRQGAEAP